MPTILNRYGVNAAIKNIIRSANRCLVIISPFQKPDVWIQTMLENASERGVETFIVFGKKDMDQDHMDWYRSLNNVSIGFVSELHAKAYYNENMAVITSMNLYDYSRRFNEELGVLFDSVEDPNEMVSLEAQILRILDEVERIYGEWNTRIILDNIPSLRPDPSIDNGITYRCIHCGALLPHGSENVYCSSCMIAWRRECDTYRMESNGFCHRCGCLLDASAERPFCNDCFRVDRETALSRRNSMRKIHMEFKRDMRR